MKKQAVRGEMHGCKVKKKEERRTVKNKKKTGTKLYKGRNYYLDDACSQHLTFA